MGLSIQTTTYNIIYVYSRKEIPDALKIGKASIVASSPEGLEPNCEELNEAAIECIKKQTQRTAADFKLLHTELGWYEDAKGQGQCFDDNFVHEVLRNNGYQKKEFDYEILNPQDWYRVDLATVKKALAAIKSEKYIIDKPAEGEKKPIKFRQEQKDAIENTIDHFQTGHKMLWNAKMRFGKTLCALDLIRQQDYQRVLILTHKPAVRSGWFEDYHKIDLKNYQYGSKEGSVTNLCNTWVVKDNGKEERKYDTKGKDFATLAKDFQDQGTHFIYFASMQDLRGSKNVSDKGIDKNNEVFNTDWDLIILDEAHEGTETELGKNVIKGLCNSRSPYLLYLSGTPFNILYHFTEEEIFTWDYVMEQEAKEKWADEHPDETNPYEGLAALNIYTYNLGEVFTKNDYTRSDDDYFNFAEFFRTWKGDEKADGAPLPSEDAKGNFVHEDDVKSFLDLLCDPNSDSKYPFTTEEFCNGLSHTLWMLPGVDAAKALTQLINNHKLHTTLGFTVIDVAGEGSKIEGLDEDDTKKIEKLGKDMLDKVKAVIKVQPRTITLSCGRLTTGVSVPEWTGVFMLRGGYDVDAGNYMQTIFRGQTPYKNGAIKSNCYAFDFSPDRTLTVVYDYVKSQPKKREGKTNGERVASLLKFCPVIAMSGGNEDSIDAMSLMDRVHEAYKEHYKRHGLKGSRFMKGWNEEAYKLFEQIGKLFNKEKVSKTRDGKIDLSKSDLKGNKGSKKGKSKKKPVPPKHSKTPKTEEDRREKAQNIADQILTRLPLLLFGAVTDTSNLSFKELLQNNVIDDESWSIFMPEGFTKAMFEQVAEHLKEEGIIVIADSIIKEAQEADTYPVEKRVKEIAGMLRVFHYPDHETVLTPWRVVNMHMGDTIGGYNFYDESYKNTIAQPRWVEAEDDVSTKVFKTPDTQILEINSKSGVYPLYLSYTLWRVKCENAKPPTEAAKLAIWDEVLKNNVFVLCQTQMAKKITERVLRGYRDAETHCLVYPNLVKILRAKDNVKNRAKKEKLIKSLQSTKYWNVNNGKKEMKFSAVVSNPPYQTGVNKEPLYHLFIDLGRQLGDIGSIIHPARFLFNAGKTPKVWNQKMLNDEHYKVVKYWSKGTEVFDSVTIKGGVAVTMWNQQVDYGKIGTFVTMQDLGAINRLVWNTATDSFSTLVYSRDLYQLVEKFYEENPTLDNRQSKGHRFDVGTTVFTLFPEVFTEDKPADEGYAFVVGRENDHRIGKWIKKEYMKLPDNFDSYKIFMTVVNGSGVFGEILSDPFVAEPQYAHNTTFLSVGKFDTKEEADACLKYMKTKFARCMLGIYKKTHHTTRKAWVAVPLQDFTSESDIDWTQPIENIDQQLYAKYGLQDYVDFIESTLKPME